MFILHIYFLIHLKKIFLHIYFLIHLKKFFLHIYFLIHFKIISNFLNMN